ncbi:MAG: class I SAM-dependent methyltransferase [Patescibacteria group bacterium]
MQTNDKTWNEYYAERNLSAANILLHYHYLIKIIFYNPEKLLEIGCGPAQHALWLKKILPKLKVSVLDSDKKLLERIKKNTSDKIENFFNINILDRNEIERLPKFDFIISQGLMEHFNDFEFIQIIKNFSSLSKKMIFSVPSDVYKNQDFGNEILRSKEDIEKLLKNSGYTFKVSNYLFDIGVRTKINLIKQNKYSFFKSLILLLFKSCHIIVEIDYQI